MKSSPTPMLSPKMSRTTLQIPPGELDPAEKSRVHVYYVAIIDLMIWAIQLIHNIYVVISGILFLSGQDPYQKHGSPYHHHQDQEVTPLGLSILATVYCIHCVVEWIIVYGLLTASNPGTPAQEAIHKAKRYQIYRLFFIVLKIVLSLIISLLGGWIEMTGIGLLYFAHRLASVFIVHEFIEDLQRGQREPQRPRNL